MRDASFTDVFLEEEMQMFCYIAALLNICATLFWVPVTLSPVPVVGSECIFSSMKLVVLSQTEVVVQEHNKTITVASSKHPCVLSVVT